LFLLLCRGYILGKPFPVVRRVLTNRGLARQSVFTAIETMNGQTFGKREMGKTVGKEWWEETSHNRRDKCRSFSCRLTRLFESKKEMSSVFDGRDEGELNVSRPGHDCGRKVMTVGRSAISVFVAKRAIARSRRNALLGVPFTDFPSSNDRFLCSP